MPAAAPRPGGMPIAHARRRGVIYDGNMPRPGHRLSRPLYEGLPWIYVICGLAALVASYLSSHKGLSLAVGVLGFLGVLGGVVVLLRRRDYRALRSQYGNQGSLADLADLEKDSG